MATPIGTYTLTDLRANRFTSVTEFGVDNINQILQNDLAATNAIVIELQGELAERSTDKQRIYGASIDGDMVEVDELARSATKKPSVGSGVGFPLKNFQYPIGWDERWIKRASVGELAERAMAAETAYLKAHRRDLKRALFLSSNYTSRDINSVPITDLAVKRLVNADSMAIPNGPDGSTFNAATHTHYLATATMTAAGLTAAINTVIEHGFGERIIAAFNYADEATVRTLTGFVPAPDYRVIPANNAAYTRDVTNPGSYYNRFIGIFGAAEVWIKPWAIANYAFIWDAGSSMKPLVLREDSVNGFQGLRLAAQLDTYPLYAQYFEAMFGYGAYTRTNGAAWYFASASYTDPTITS
jgi:hypothetical protein